MEGLQNAIQKSVNTKYSTFRYTLIGVAGHIERAPWRGGLRNTHMCMPEHLTEIFFRVTSVMDWIIENTRVEKPAPKNSNCQSISGGSGSGKLKTDKKFKVGVGTSLIVMLNML